MGGRSFLALCLAVGACQLAGPGTGGPGPGALPAPVLAEGELSRAESAEAEQLYRSAEASFQARRFFEVLRTTSDLMERFPSASVSGAALLLSARAELELGAMQRADSLAERYLDLLPPGDPRSTDVRILQAQALQGEPARQLDRLLRIGEAADPEELAVAIPLAREASDSLPADELEALLASVPTDGPLAPIPQVRHAVDLLDRGESERASQVARAALAGGAPEPEATVAEGVLRGELPADRVRVRSFAVGTVLPVGGPPALAGFAAGVSEGIEVAVAAVLGDEYTVDVRARDDEANPALAALLTSELEIEGVAGVVGFLEDEALLAAGQSRAENLVIVSPTARTADQAGEGVYSLEGPDPIAARAVARYAVSRAHQHVAIILPFSDAAIEEAAAFEAEAGRFGVSVVQRFYYEPGATDFEAQFVGARDALRAAEIAALGLGQDDTLRVEVLEPAGVFLPIPREDVPYLAPQLSHFGLDTLAIEVMGTSAWTDSGVLETVAAPYMNGVVATAPVGVEPSSPGRERFRTAYEEHFQRTLVSEAPALGYDATLLLLEALRPGRVQPQQILESFRALADVEGATGVFSVIDDRVVRRTELVRIRNGAYEPLVEY